ncbi:hypothetical protein [Streptomyces zinciresistens]|uniref:hypothetical protein n=1 Tax=Streptomyces zinciresistens TaxID=1073330 RepID=UPI0005C1FA87|nr:hypothetical protein [Streptomyces zinciresistens]
MSTGVIIVIVIAVAVVVTGAVALAQRTRGAQGSRGLKRRFGPEYERAVARHDGDSQAAERELAELVERHGGLRERELERTEAERYEARWAATQEHFVDAPREAVGEADRLLAELARARGFPDGERYEEQLSALAVHHATHVQGYRHLHHVARNGSDTEEMRTAMIEGRALFQELVGASSGRSAGRSTAGRS